MQCWGHPGSPLGKDGDAGPGSCLGSREGTSWGSQRVQEKDGSKKRRREDRRNTLGRKRVHYRDTHP